MKNYATDVKQTIQMTTAAMATALLLAAPFTLHADSSFKGTYQFGMGSMEPREPVEVTISDMYNDRPSGAYATPKGHSATGKTDIAANDSNKYTPAVPGFIGVY